MAIPSVRLDEVSKQYVVLSARTRIWAVKQLSFQCQPGQLTLLEGKNGSGKSTLLRLIAGLEKPTQGRVVVTVSGPKAIGYMPENPRFHKKTTAYQFVRYLAQLRGLPKPGELAAELLNQFGLNQKWHHLNAEVYSEGMRQRLGLVIAFMGEPAILLLDEPLENLDQQTQALVLERILTTKRSGKTVIVATHNLDQFQNVADQQINLGGTSVA